MFTLSLQCVQSLFPPNLFSVKRTRDVWSTKRKGKFLSPFHPRFTVNLYNLFPIVCRVWRKQDEVVVFISHVVFGLETQPEAQRAQTHVTRCNVIYFLSKRLWWGGTWPLSEPVSRYRRPLKETLYELMKGVTVVTQWSLKSTKTINTRQNTKEYIKGKHFSFIVLNKSSNLSLFSARKPQYFNSHTTFWHK